MKPLRSLWLLMLMPLLGGCAAVVVGGVAAGALAFHDRRTVSAVVDDQKLEIEASRKLDANPRMAGDNHIRVVSFNGVMLLAGEVPNPEQRTVAESLVKPIAGVRRVVNDLAVTEPSSLSRRLHDSWLTTEAKSQLLGIDLDGFDPTRVKVVTVRGNMYLMGLVTQAEANAVVERLRKMRGVKRVVKVFEIQNA